MATDFLIQMYRELNEHFPTDTREPKLVWDSAASRRMDARVNELVVEGADNADAHFTLFLEDHCGEPWAIALQREAMRAVASGDYSKLEVATLDAKKHWLESYESYDKGAYRKAAESEGA
jgi:hypothetical protein